MKTCSHCGSTKADWPRDRGGRLKKHCGCVSRAGWSEDGAAVKRKNDAKYRAGDAYAAWKERTTGYGAGELRRMRAVHRKAHEVARARTKPAPIPTHDAHVKVWRANEAVRYRWRYANQPRFQLKERLRRQLRKKTEAMPGVAELIALALKRDGRSPKVEALLGYSMAQLKTHIERQFTPGMDWSQWSKGGFHIDHILPKKCFDLRTIEGIQAYWALSNLRPISAKRNLSKSSKVLFLC